MGEKNFNTCEWNIGRYNTGDYNTGSFNASDYNVGNYNTGDYNVGNYDTGDYNVGNCNTGDCNTGDWNTGNYNTGDWNKASFSTGCFNTEEQNIMFFNKPSNWSYRDWLCSDARYILNKIPPAVEWVDRDEMYDNTEGYHPESKVTGGYLKVNKENNRQLWWDRLSDSERNIIEALPNFDSGIFFQLTGIKVEEE